ncbi:serine hydrolase domain-containing protein [Chryseobacterium proteolyticum]|uniref:serine hydrolase domain-containing protein n=1 Tax=Chryseobacterium proteolyticum TaxID=118127 RepID=UPI003983CC91
MKSYFLLILCIFSSYGYGQETASAIEAIIKREMAERKIPGLQIAVVKEGKVIVKRSFGVANVQDQVPVTDTTVFAINSCTKVFTGTAIMQLAEQGKVDLSAPVSRYLDDLPEQWQKVTIEQMMTHISGFPEILKLFDPATGDTSKTEKKSGTNLRDCLWNSRQVSSLATIKRTIIYWERL